eukprot:jgi/Mesvir1/9761/Mv12216-RA.1
MAALADANEKLTSKVHLLSESVERRAQNSTVREEALSSRLTSAEKALDALTKSTAADAGQVKELAQQVKTLEATVKDLAEGMDRAARRDPGGVTPEMLSALEARVDVAEAKATESERKATSAADDASRSLSLANTLEGEVHSHGRRIGDLEARGGGGNNTGRSEALIACEARMQTLEELVRAMNRDIAAKVQRAPSRDAGGWKAVNGGGTKVKSGPDVPADLAGRVQQLESSVEKLLAELVDMAAQGAALQRLQGAAQGGDGSGSAAQLGMLLELQKTVRGLEKDSLSFADQFTAVRRALEQMQEVIDALRGLPEDVTAMKSAQQTFVKNVKGLGDHINRVANELSGIKRGRPIEDDVQYASKAELDVLGLDVAMKVDQSAMIEWHNSAVNSALEAIQAMRELDESDDGTGARAVRFQCLSCDRMVENKRPKPLGILPSRRGLLPEMQSFMPSAMPLQMQYQPGGSTSPMSVTGGLTDRDTATRRNISQKDLVGTSNSNSNGGNRSPTKGAGSPSPGSPMSTMGSRSRRPQSAYPQSPTIAGGRSGKVGGGGGGSPLAHEIPRPQSSQGIRSSLLAKERPPSAGPHTFEEA